MKKPNAKGNGDCRFVFSIHLYGILAGDLFQSPFIYSFVDFVQVAADIRRLAEQWHKSERFAKFLKSDG